MARKQKGLNKIAILLVLLVIVAAIFIVVNIINSNKVNLVTINKEDVVYYVLRKEGKVGILDKDGNVVIEPKYADVMIPNPTKDTFIVTDSFEAETKWYAVNKSGEKILTQYANLQKKPNDFDAALGIIDEDNFGHFFVPENVYIIGTMNDIDRSVESMDFAMRRRFAFKEIKASDRAEDMFKELGANKDEAAKRMNALNASIKKIPGLSTAYHIGPAYFLKLSNYNGDFEQLWTNHIEGLLREYLRGMDKVEEKIENLKNAFDTGVATESSES